MTLVESPKHCCFVDPQTLDVFLDVDRKLHLKFYPTPKGKPKKYMFNAIYCKYLHTILANALIYNERPDLFDIVDHVDGDSLNNDLTNLRHANAHLNSLNQPGTRNVLLSTLRGNKIWWVRKCGIRVKSFKTEEGAVDFAHDLNARFHDRCREIYKNAPLGPTAQKHYFAKHFVPVRHYRKETRSPTHRSEILGLRTIVVGSRLFDRLT